MTVTVEPDLFEAIGEPDGEGWEGSPAFLVVADDVAGAAAALHAAGERFMLIDEHGRELAEWESDTGEAYTPNWVSDVSLSERGPVLRVDTKGYLTAPMGAAMVQALTEELTARRVTAHVTTPPHGLSSARLPKWQPPTAAPKDAPSGPEVPKTWFVCRSVERTTTDGRPYGDTEYRAADGTWGGRRSAAERFAEPPDELVHRLRAEPRPPGRGEVNGILLPDDDSEWHPMPPPELREPT
jgi:hypothetical protein